MRILLVSYVYPPSVGGIETVSELLAREFLAAGHEVVVVTWTSEGGAEHDGCRVVRRPGAWALLRWTRWAEVVMHNNLSLRAAWPLLLVHRPWVVATHTWISAADGRVGWGARLKRLALRGASNISVSRAVATHIGVASVVVPNPYREDLFRELPDIARDRDLVFLGRLVSDKGADLLLEALADLATLGLRPGCTLIGGGPEEPRLRALVAERGLSAQVDFAGVLRGRELVERLNRHRVLVAPSRWQEPFGLVALEGIACGCVAVTSSGGGLPDAAGACGVSFPNGDRAALVALLAALLGDAQRVSGLRAAAAEHLARHRGATVAARYLDVLQAARAGRPLGVPA